MSTRLTCLATATYTDIVAQCHRLPFARAGSSDNLRVISSIFDSAVLRLAYEVTPGELCTGEPQATCASPSGKFDVPELAISNGFHCGHEVSVGREQDRSVVTSGHAECDQIDRQCDIDTLFRGWRIRPVMGIPQWASYDGNKRAALP